MSLGDRLSDVLEMERRDEQSGGRALEIVSGLLRFLKWLPSSLSLELQAARRSNNGGRYFMVGCVVPDPVLMLLTYERAHTEII